MREISAKRPWALAENLQPECIADTVICGIPLRFQEACASNINLTCAVAVCGVDNNPARVAASKFYRRLGIPVIFAGVSVSADHGYVFVQDSRGPCIGCLLPDIGSDDYFPCPGTPAVGDILQAVGALAIYAIDSLLMNRPREWNYRRVSLARESTLPRRNSSPRILDARSALLLKPSHFRRPRNHVP